MKKSIYLAAPIHQQEDFNLNADLLILLREQGFEVWSPQEAGIASDEARRTGEPLDTVRARYMRKDLSAMEQCDICVAYLGRERTFSEGMLWEMGWYVGQGKPVVLYNPCNNKLTLMAQFTVDYIVDTFQALIEALNVYV